ncbi:MAG: GspE/PulE family protein [Candidatus Omnitrophota bacterium]
MGNLSERIIAVLKESKRVTQADIDRALAIYSKEGGGKLKDILVRMGVISEKELLGLLSEEVKIPFLNLAKYKINKDLAKLIPEKTARKHSVVPIAEMGRTLTVAMLDPFNVFAIDDIALFTKHKVECVISTEKDIEEALNRLYVRDIETMSAVAESLESSEAVEFLKGEEGLEMGGQSERVGTEAPVVRMVDLLIREALKKRASDIHIEPFEKKVRVRYRIDGNLEETLIMPKKSQNGVVARLKIMSRLDITENRVPQDGRFKIKLQDREVDFRMSILPVHFGSKVVMRILDKTNFQIGLDHLGFSADSLEKIKAAVAKPFGMILMTGPTGSGKSTTLYSILSLLNTPDKNIITVEDPIEYQARGITQIQVKPDIGLDFANGLRAILRQSPDVVMVGEIRDFETVDTAIKASLTGQLVLSTLHTNDAAGAMTRLIDMGVEPFLISSSVILVVAQRLCRKVCSYCKEKIDIPAEVFERMGISMDKLLAGDPKKNFYRGRGCAKCNKSGYLGRMGILETLVVDDEIRNLVLKQASAHEVKMAAIRSGMKTLREDALTKLTSGLTTLDEVIRITSGEE